MEFRPILSALRRSPTGAHPRGAADRAGARDHRQLDVHHRAAAREDRPRPGLDVPNIVRRVVRADRQGLQRPRSRCARTCSCCGVCRASSTPRRSTRIPLSGGGSATSVLHGTRRKGPGRRRSTTSRSTSTASTTLGVQARRGPQFRRERRHASRDRNSARRSAGGHPERAPWPRSCSATSPRSARRVYDGLGQPAPVVGVIENMHGSWPTWEKLDHIVLLPAIADERCAVYLVRAKPGQRDAMMKLAEERLSAIDNGRIITKVRSLETIAAGSYADDRAMAVYLTRRDRAAARRSRRSAFSGSPRSTSARGRSRSARAGPSARGGSTSSAISWSRTGSITTGRRRWPAACWRCCSASGSARRSNCRA